MGINGTGENISFLGADLEGADLGDLLKYILRHLVFAQYRASHCSPG